MSTDRNSQPPPETTAAGSEDASPRRGFLTKFLAIVIGGIAGLFPLIVGLLVFLDPLRSRRKGGGKGFVKVAALDALLVGKPRRVTVYDDRVDAWNLFLQEPIGAVYLLRNEDDSVVAFTAVCPHAGCPVDWDPDRTLYQCPCHDSSFKIDGSLANPKSPAARGLDSLEIDNSRLAEGEVWVRYQNFRAGTSEKIVVS